MLTGSRRVNVGDNVTTNTIIGQMDSTRKCNGATLTSGMFDYFTMAM